MIPRETGRGLSISGAHRVAAVERLVGATLVVALPRTDTTVRRPLPGHYRAGQGVERRPSGRREWRRGAATQPGNDATPGGTHKGCPYGHRGIGPTGRLETALPVGDWKSPLLAKNTGRVKYALPVSARNTPLQAAPGRTPVPVGAEDDAAPAGRPALEVSKKKKKGGQESPPS